MRLVHGGGCRGLRLCVPDDRAAGRAGRARRAAADQVAGSMQPDRRPVRGDASYDGNDQAVNQRRRTMTRRVLRANPGESLTMDEMRRSLPSIFAAEPHESRSHRYVYISTEEMLERMMLGGFLPV